MTRSSSFFFATGTAAVLAVSTIIGLGGSIVWWLKHRESIINSSPCKCTDGDRCNGCSCCSCCIDCKCQKTTANTTISTPSSSSSLPLLHYAGDSENPQTRHFSTVREATLMVCTKCTVANRPEWKAENTTTTNPTDEQHPPGPLVKPKTGLAMWEALLTAFNQSPSWRLYCNDGITSVLYERLDTNTTTNPSSSSTTPTHLRLSQQQCFSACSRANCVVACGQSDRHTFHFGNLDPVQEDVEDILRFVEQWTGPDGEEAAQLAKAPGRPARLGKANTISRLPPAVK